MGHALNTHRLPVLLPSGATAMLMPNPSNSFGYQLNQTDLPTINICQLLLCTSFVIFQFQVFSNSLYQWSLNVPFTSWWRMSGARSCQMLAWGKSSVNSCIWTLETRIQFEIWSHLPQCWHQCPTHPKRWQDRVLQWVPEPAPTYVVHHHYLGY